MGLFISYGSSRGLISSTKFLISLRNFIDKISVIMLKEISIKKKIIISSTSIEQFDSVVMHSLTTIFINPTFALVVFPFFGWVWISLLLLFYLLPIF